MESNPLSSINPLNMAGIQASIDTLSDILSKVAEKVYYCVRYGMSLSENLTDESIAKKIIIHDAGVKLTTAIDHINSYDLPGTQITRWMGSLIEATGQLAINKGVQDVDPKELSQLIQITAHKTDNQKLVQGLLDKLKDRLTWELKQTPQISKALEAFKELALVGAARGNLSPQDQSALQTIISNPTQSSNLMQTPIFHKMVIDTFGAVQELTTEQKKINYDNKIDDFLSGRKKTPALRGQLVEVTEDPESPLEIAARIGNTGGLDFLIRTTRPWETSGEIMRLISIAEAGIIDPIKKGNFINTFITLYMLYDRKSMLKVSREFVLETIQKFPQLLRNDREFMLEVLKGCSEGLRNNKEFMLGVLEGCKELRSNKEFMLEVLKGCSEGLRNNKEFILKVLKGCSEELRNDREFILGVIKEAPNLYASIIDINVLGKKLRDPLFIQEMVATLADTVKKNAQRRQKG